MSSKTKPNNAADLLAAIQRKGIINTDPSVVPLAVVEEDRAVQKTMRGGATSRVGKPVQFWLHDEDRQIVRELAAWLAGQGIRSTDSMVIRAALRTANTGGELLDAYRKAAQLDGRLKQHKIAS